MVIPVIDVSEWQGAIDWQAVAESGVVGVYMKATENDDFQDERFPDNWKGAKAAGLVRGAYHFSRPSSNPDPTKEVYYFLDYIDANGGLEVGDFLVQDMEDQKVAANADMGGWTNYWMQIAANIVGFNPLLYSGPWYIEPHKLNTKELGNYGLILAAYQAVQPSPPSSWDFLTMWQYTDKGSVPGIIGDVDRDWFNGTKEQLLAYGKQGVPPIVVPQPTSTYTIEEAYKELQLVQSNISNILDKMKTLLGKDI